MSIVVLAALVLAVAFLLVDRQPTFESPRAAVDAVSLPEGWSEVSREMLPSSCDDAFARRCPSIRVDYHVAAEVGLSPSAVGTGEAIDTYAAAAAAAGLEQPGGEIFADLQAPADVETGTLRSSAVGLWLLAHPRADGGVNITLYGIPLPR